MPYRTVPLVNGEIYHVVNRGVNHQPIFSDKRDYGRAQEILYFYQFSDPPTSYSKFKALADDQRQLILSKLQEGNSTLVSLVAYCFMPNHFHALIKQELENGISKYIANFQNSYTRFFNLKHERSGHLFQGQFKSVRVETQNQLLHTARYIHLNPYTSYVIKNTDELAGYPWSSLREYIEGNPDICQTEIILSAFPNKEKHLDFVLDQKDYQRALAQFKHLSLE